MRVKTGRKGRRERRSEGGGCMQIGRIRKPDAMRDDRRSRSAEAAARTNGRATCSHQSSRNM
eukprot:6213864-Pleurochrysis_carterae.AAC.3